MIMKGLIGKPCHITQKLDRLHGFTKCSLIYSNKENLPQINSKLPLLIDRKSFSNSFILNKLNAHFRLQRFHSPLPIILMACPVLTSAVIACPYEITMNELYKMGLLFLGCITTRTAGCIINDIFDRRFDKNVERTKTRPLASGELSVREALIPLSLNLTSSLAILLQFDSTTIELGLLASVMGVIYPLLKRYTYYPQIFLGVSFNFGIIMAWTAIKGGTFFTGNWVSPICLYGFSILWTLVYDTVYAHQDKIYDKRLKLKSTALEWGEKTKQISGALATQMAINLIITGYYAELSPVYYVSTLGAIGYLIRNLTRTNFDNSADCQKFFDRNYLIGLSLLIGSILGKSFKLYIGEDE